MVGTKKITLARFTLVADDFTTTDRIDFNDGSASNFKDSGKEGAYFIKLKKTKPEGIGNNQGVEKPDGNVQALGIIETTYVFTGFITKTDGNSDDGNNAFLNKLEIWKDEAQSLKDVYEGGRFGILDLNDNTNNLTPIGTGPNTIGLIFRDYQKEFDPVKNRDDITLFFRVSRGSDI